MNKRYSCGCYSNLDNEKLSNAVHVGYPCFKHMRGGPAKTIRFAFHGTKVISVKVKLVSKQ